MTGMKHTVAPYSIWCGIAGLGTIALSGCGGSGGDGGNAGNNTTPPPSSSFEASHIASRMVFVGDPDVALAILNGYALRATYETDSNNVRDLRFYFEPQPGDETMFTLPERWGKNAHTWFAGAYLVADNVVCIDAPGYFTHINTVSGDVSGTFTFRECQRGEIDAAKMSNNWQPVYLEDFTGEQALANAIFDSDGNFVEWNLNAAIDMNNDVLLYMDNPNAAYSQEALIDLERNIICANFLALAGGAIIQVSADNEAPAPLTTQGLEQYDLDGTLTDVSLLRCSYQLSDWQ